MCKRPLFFYGWFIVATGMVVTALGYGSRYSFSVIFPALLDTFQWPRDVTAAMLSVHFLVYGFVAPVAGGLVDKIGPRRIMVLGVMLLASGLALSGWSSEPWHFYLSYGVLSGIGLCLIGAVPFTIIIGKWFERKRGLAFALLFSGAGFSQAFYPVIAFLVNGIGWRSTFLVEAITVTAVSVPLIITVVRYHPREKGLVRDGIEQSRETSAGTVMQELRIRDKTWVATDWTFAKAARTTRLWLLYLATFSVWGVTEHILVAHHVAFAIDMGYSSIYAASVLALFGFFCSGGSLVSLVSDRIGRESTMTIGTIIGISGIVALILIQDASHPWMLYYYAATFGFGIGIVSPTIAAAATDIFQGAKVGAIIGFVWFGFSVGGTIGPWLGGWIFERTGSYLSAFLVAAILFAVSCAAVWLAEPRKVRLVPGKVRPSSLYN